MDSLFNWSWPTQDAPPEPTRDRGNRRHAGPQPTPPKDRGEGLGKPSEDRENTLAAAVVVHELPGRVRLRVRWLCVCRDAKALETAISALSGSRRVRLNVYASSILAEYDEGSEFRAELFKLIAGWSPAAAPTEASIAAPAPVSGAAVPNPHRVPLLLSCLATLAVPFLPMPVKVLVTVSNIGGTVLKGLQTLGRRGLKIEVLDAIAVSIAAWQGCYFTANATRTLLKSGEYLDHQNERQTDALLQSLLRPRIERVWIEREGDLIEIEAHCLQIQDLVVLGPGAAVPVDGEVAAGAALIDQSCLTGESIPSRREKGDPVLSGSLVIEGSIKLRATRVGAETTSARINTYVEEAMRRPSEMQRLAERLGDRLVYLTLGLGALLYAATRDPRRVASAFLVDYSCALKLGTPVTFKSAMYRSAKAGILFKGAGVMEALASADTVIFDKTGTLTDGLLEVTDVVPLRGERSEHELLAVVASLEEHTRHPFAEAVVRQAQHAGVGHIGHGDVEYIVAHGLKAGVNGNTLLLGSRHFLEDHEGIDFACCEGEIERLEAEGKTLLHVAEDGAVVGLLALRDSLRPDAAETLSRLRRLGVKQLIMLTGDHPDKAHALALDLDLDQVYARRHPEDKAELIRELAAAGHRIVFVGDGVNDAPGLASAAVSVCMPRGATISRELAGMLLLRDRLSDLAIARELALDAVARVRSNFTLDVWLNSAVLLGASAGLLHPLAASLLHNSATLAIMLRAANPRLPQSLSETPVSTPGGA
ncbi:MAG: heavy metal translocating P-type ATPase [Methylotetracoccus sp.]|nr:heavy metal translocating P-type ATPase [Methylotetracoccus sp.]